MYSEQDLKYAEEFREGIHRDALMKVRAVYPDAGDVVDEYQADEYFQEVWDYPGKWYTVVGTPPGAGGRQALVDAIVRRTIEYCRNARMAHTDDEFRNLIAKYPGSPCRYCRIWPEDPHAKELGVFPCSPDSHRLALECAARKLFAGKYAFDAKKARCRKLSGKALFAPSEADEWLNYRRAFLCRPKGNSYTDSDFEKVNSVLFPGGAEELEVFRWTTDWAEYFVKDGARESLCLSVYDKTLGRFVVIMAAAKA